VWPQDFVYEPRDLSGVHVASPQPLPTSQNMKFYSVGISSRRLTARVGHTRKKHLAYFFFFFVFVSTNLVYLHVHDKEIRGKCLSFTNFPPMFINKIVKKTRIFSDYIISESFN
jgi:hypothetical protein